MRTAFKQFCPVCDNIMVCRWNANRFLNDPIIPVSEDDQRRLPGCDMVAYRVVWTCDKDKIKITDYLIMQDPHPFMEKYEEVGE